ncbi:uncharacterized protein LOC126833028 [Adelges cooleyi]|uniref:uncharacterized protein LOC126833028 n=1 Tax=Adelges cooleyi TaxID=133065 RepID=UPI002180605B|nr:uncharacterized protein LOC126833028 [Adelges cooleyi]
MFFKLSILLLSFIIAANYVLGESEDENQILKDSDNDCRKWLLVSLDSTITLADFWMYMGKNKNDLIIIEEYLSKNPAASEKQDVIDLHLYSELFRNLCITLGYIVKRCAALRKSAAAERSIEDITMLEWVESVIV